MQMSRVGSWRRGQAREHPLSPESEHLLAGKKLKVLQVQLQDC